MQFPQNFLTTEYLFSAVRPADPKRFLIELGIFAIIIIIAIILGFNKKIHRGLKNRLYNFLLTIGILGVIILWFRWESINYLGNRFVEILLLLTIVIWYFAITAYAVFKMPREVRLRKSEDRYRYYLPKKKLNKKGK
ncbi:MAG: hypothetical protein NTW79_00140 [Candidatus Berkelbacteria bacterium]|nr:hypothetical protein [Candidatus Berkelbacteria bacterium]